MFSAVLLMLYGVISALILPTETFFRLPIPDVMLVITAPFSRYGKSTCTILAEPITLVVMCDCKEYADIFKLVCCCECWIAALLIKVLILKSAPRADTSRVPTFEIESYDEISHSIRWTQLLLLDSIA